MKLSERELNKNAFAVGLHGCGMGGANTFPGAQKAVWELAARRPHSSYYPLLRPSCGGVREVLGGPLAFQVLSRWELLPEQGGDLTLRKTGFRSTLFTAASGTAGLGDGTEAVPAPSS